MLEFIIGRAGSGKTQLCLDAVKEGLLASPQGKPLVLLVPDHMTFAVERQLAESMQKHGGFTRAYVLGMSRLAYQVLQRCGGALHPHLNETGRQLLLSRVLSHKKLSVLAKASRQHHFTSSVSNLIEEFKTACISAQQLQDFAAQTDSETLRQKLNDLAAIYRGLDEQMQGRYHDSQDIMQLALRRLPQCDWLRSSEIWIDGFDAFNQQHLLVIKQLLALADNVHLTLCISNLNTAEHEAETALFHRQYIVYSQVSALARRAGCAVKVKQLQGSRRSASGDLAFIEKQLFSFPLKQSEARGGLHVVEAANRRLECEAAAAGMLHLCRDKGYRRSDIGVLLRSEDEYADVLQTVLNDYGIPFFSDSRRQSAHHPLAELMRSALEAVRTWQYEPLFRAFKTDLFDASRSDIDALENYVLAFGIRGRKLWLTEDKWQFSRIRSIDAGTLAADDEETALIDKVNTVRDAVMPPLAGLSRRIQAAQTAGDFTLALYDFLVDMDVPQKLGKWQQQAAESGDAALAKEHRQIWNSITELMDQIVQTCGNDAINAKDYEQLINDGLDSIQIALIPPGCDYVTIAPFEHNTLNNKKAIFILGANEGMMPRRSRCEGLLSDAERLLMAGAGLNISSGAGEENFAERYLLYKGFSLAKEFLWVSYALADAEGRELNKSILISRLAKILPNRFFTSVPLETVFQHRDMQVTTPRRSLSGLVAALRRYRDGGSIDAFWNDVYDYLLGTELPLSTALAGLFAVAPQDQLPPALAAKTYAKNRVLRGSVTRFEEFYRCPFRHFAHYALNLQERDEFKFAAPDLGVLLHAVMHRFGDRLQKQQRSWDSVQPEECRQLCHEIVNDLAPKLQNRILLSTSRYKHLLSRIEMLAAASLQRLIEFSGHSRFRPRALEQQFGGRDDMPPLLFDGTGGCKIEITGQIDRIDVSGGYYLVIDYKSGKAMINLLQVYYGLRLQLLTYLLAAKNASSLLCRTEDAIPAGILYCFLRRPSLMAKKHLSRAEIQQMVRREMRMPGWVLADPDVIRSIDDSLSYIKVSLKKDDTISSASRAYVKTQDEFELLLNHIEETLRHAGTCILNGDARIFPYRLKEETACTYCPYIAVCRFDKDVSGYEYNEIDDMSDDEIISLLKSAQKTALENAEKGNDKPCPGPSSN